MDIDIEKIDIEKLRNDLLDYFTSAMFVVTSVALMDLIEVKNANEEQLIRIAVSNNFNLNYYTKEYGR